MIDIFLKIISVDTILFTILNYKLSFIELLGTVSGLFCVWLTAKEKIICWAVGILNILCFFVMFYQVQLYSDMLLQLFFLIMSIYGWYSWANPKTKEDSNKNNKLKVSFLKRKNLIIISSITILSTFLLGLIMRKIHIILPLIFKEPASFPFGDAFTTTASVVATVLMTRKKIDCWLFWIVTDIVAVFIYFMKGINLVAIEYIVFGLISLNGYLTWRKAYKKSVLTEKLA